MNNWRSLNAFTFQLYTLATIINNNLDIIYIYIFMYISQIPLPSLYLKNYKTYMNLKFGIVVPLMISVQ